MVKDQESFHLTLLLRADFENSRNIVCGCYTCRDHTGSSNVCCGLLLYHSGLRPAWFSTTIMKTILPHFGSFVKWKTENKPPDRPKSGLPDTVKAERKFSNKSGFDVVIL